MCESKQVCACKSGQKSMGVNVCMCMCVNKHE